MERTVIQKVQGMPAIDGAGVHLVRVLGRGTVKSFDPFLMLDSFDSQNPADYTAGFPMHPHRGIETISFLSQGGMTHSDSLGFEDSITSGEVQWMTAGSGILHEEKIPAAPRMLGLQMWLNMPEKDKMSKPSYKAIKKEEIKEIPIEGGTLRLLAGDYKEHKGYKGNYLPLIYYHILLNKGAELTLDVPEDYTAFVFTLLGNAEVAGNKVNEKTAALTSQGDTLTIKAPESDIQIMFAASKKLNESVAWGGPIVMNTEDELRQAFAELRDGTFLDN
ncbi:MAG: pirin family protein [Eubacteriales bacterium]|nr:pirin family protein [Eubacteriales bacterium]